jgi:hypothetical protein
MSDRISQTEAQQLQTRVQNVAASAREQRFLLSQVVGSAAAGYAVGHVSVSNPSMNSFGPGGKLNLRHVTAAAGLWLGRKRSRTGAIARGAGLGAIFSLAYEAGAKAAAEKAASK